MANLKNLFIDGVSIFELMYPVGSIYETSDADFDPSVNFGGTWQRIKGKVLVGVDEDDSTFASSKLSGGEKAHKLTTSEMPSHSHTVNRNDGTKLSSWQTNAGAGSVWWVVCDGTISSPGASLKAESVGGSASHNNLQPYYTVYIWERVS